MACACTGSRRRSRTRPTGQARCRASCPRRRSRPTRREIAGECRGDRAPMAFRTPISRVRSVTEASKHVHDADAADEQGDAGDGAHEQLEDEDALRSPATSRCVDVSHLDPPFPAAESLRDPVLDDAPSSRSTSSRRRAFTSSVGVRGATVGGSTMPAAANGTYRFERTLALVGRQNADDIARISVDANGAPDHRRWSAASRQLAGELVREHDDRGVSCRLDRREIPTVRRTRAA